MDYKVSFSAMGGLGEIGLNSYIYNIFDEANSNYLIVDLGMGFNNSSNTIVDIYYPDLTFFDDKIDEIKAILITHGHEDHIGAIPYVWYKLKCPIYATAFTADLIMEKLKEFNLEKIVELIVVIPNKTYRIGPAEIVWMPVSHSIPDCSLLFMKTPRGNIVHSGDFKINSEEEKILDNIATLQKNNIQYLFCDSTNVLEPGTSGAENTIVKELQNLILKAKGVCWITAFSSNIERLNNICSIAKSIGKKIVLFGRSHNTYSKIAARYNLLDNSVIIDEEEINNYPRNRLIFIISGSQGEDRSVLSNILLGGYFRHKIQEEDLLIFSSKVIPGNEKKVSRLYNALAKQEIEFYTAHTNHIHVSGHAKQEELKQFYSLINPKWVVPIHGETMHIKAHSKFAYENNYPTFNCPNGVIVELFEKEPTIIGEFQVGKVINEGGRIIPFNADFIKQRNKLFKEGAVFITLIADNNKIYSPIIDTLGLLTEEEEEIYISQLSKKILDFSKGALRESNIENVAEDIRILTRRFFKNLLEKKPIVRVHLIA